MKLSTLSRIAGISTAVASILALSLLFVMTHSVNIERELAQRQLEYRELGYQLVEASDLLTNEARRYTIFANKRHIDAFWKEVRETKTRDRVVERLKKLHVEPDELALVEAAKQISDGLVKLENDAMVAAGEGDLQRARQLMFDDDYDRKKNRMVALLDQFQQTIFTRVNTEALDARNRASWYQLLANAVIVTYVILVVAFLYILFVRRVVTPLVAITEAISHVSGGNLQAEIPNLVAPNELSDLAKAATHFKMTLAENVKMASDLQHHRDHLQEEVQQQTKQILSREEQMRRTFQSSPNGLLIEDGGGEISTLNSSLIEMFGQSRKDMLGRSLVDLISEHSRPDFVAYRAGFQMTNWESHAMEEFSGLRGDGSEFPIEIGLTPLEEELDGAPAAMMATIVDISERKKNESVIRLRNEQLRRVNTELLEFAYSVSHDLKGPLASITGLLAFCDSDLSQGDVAEVAVNISRAQGLASRLAKRVEATLVLAKTDMGSGGREEISVLDHIIDSWNSLPHEGVLLETTLQHVGKVRSVPSRFDTILENLLANAVKYQAADRQHKKVLVTTWSSGENFHLSVADNGVGIPVDQHDKVFRLFHRLAGQDTSGTGLGLPLVKKNVTLLAGTIELESRDDMTVFTVVLPQINDHCLTDEE